MKSIRVARVRAGYSQRELAELIGHGQAAISLCERGTSRIYLDTFLKIASALQVSPS